MAECLLVGGGGFLGAHLAESLLKVGHGVLVLDRKPYSETVQVQIASGGSSFWNNAFAATGWSPLPHVNYYSVDVARAVGWQAPIVTQWLKRVDFVYMLAGLLGSVPCTTNMTGAVQSSVLPMALLLDRLVELDARPVVVHASSDLVYGKIGEGPIVEWETCHPLCGYAATKLSAEHLLRTAFVAYDIKSVILRMSTVYGPFQQRKSIVNFFVALALEDKTLTVYGTGDVVRDWLYIDDAVNALLLPVQNERLKFGVLNVPGDQRSTKALAEAVVAVVGQGTVGSVPWPELTKRVDVGSHILDGTTIGRYGWSVTVGLEEGIARTVDFYMPAD